MPELKAALCVLLDFIVLPVAATILLVPQFQTDQLIPLGSLIARLTILFASPEHLAEEPVHAHLAQQDNIVQVWEPKIATFALLELIVQAHKPRIVCCVLQIIIALVRVDQIFSHAISVLRLALLNVNGIDQFNVLLEPIIQVMNVQNVLLVPPAQSLEPTLVQNANLEHLVKGLDPSFAPPVLRDIFVRVSDQVITNRAFCQTVD